MSVKLFIGGLSWSTSSEDLRVAFEEFGNVEDAIVINDRETGKSLSYSRPLLVMLFCISVLKASYIGCCAAFFI
jgi:hypothetical protein